MDQNTKVVSFLQKKIVASDLQALQREKEKLQKEFETQELSPIEVERLTSEKKKLKESIALLKSQKENLQRVVDEKEMQFSKKLDEMDKMVTEFNNMMVNLQLTPMNAKYAKGVNLHLTFNSTNPEESAEFLKNVVKVFRFEKEKKFNSQSCRNFAPPSHNVFLSLTTSTAQTRGFSQRIIRENSHHRRRKSGNLRRNRENRRNLAHQRGRIQCFGTNLFTNRTKTSAR